MQDPDASVLSLYGFQPLGRTGTSTTDGHGYLGAQIGNGLTPTDSCAPMPSATRVRFEPLETVRQS